MPEVRVRPLPAASQRRHAAQPRITDSWNGLTLDGDQPAITRIALACDHRGFAAKQRLCERLKNRIGKGLEEVVDCGCDGDSHGCDYPDFAIPVARRVAAGEVDVAILLDGSGIGMGIAANKVAGIRAATCHDEITARIAREHNHCNVLCVGTDLVGEKTLHRVVDTFLETRFSGGRHVRRVAKLMDHEAATFLSERHTAARRMSS